ncbi:hypothetical protein [Rubrivirga sp.]|uniref:hypothetical protein n=1 Tax=Rubrivirga sp. TaxID=1885344 RepID=UPI003C72A43F
MRLLLAFVLTAATAASQVHVRPNAGYDIAYGAPSAGIGLEAGWSVGPAASLGLRVSGDAVFVDDLPFAVAFYSDATSEGVGDASVYRLGLEVVGYWDRPGRLRPYAKAGLVTELERIARPDLEVQSAWTDAVAGLGLEVGRVYLEGTHGFGDASRRRVAVGVRL